MFTGYLLRDTVFVYCGEKASFSQKCRNYNYIVEACRVESDLPQICVTISGIIIKNIPLLEIRE